MQLYYIYTLSEPINFRNPSSSDWMVRYVGQTSEPQRRFNDHAKEARHRGNRKEIWFNSMMQQGIVPRMEIIAWAESRDEIYALEKQYILLFKTISTKKLVNGDDGGQGGKSPNASVRAKIGAANTGKVRTKEMNDEKSKMFSGEGNPFFGRTHTDETKAAIGIANKYNRNRPIMQCDMNDNELRQWDSTYDIAKELKMDNSSITKCCKGKRLSAGGFKWKYATV